MTAARQDRYALTAALTLLACLLVSGWQPFDRGVWLMEVFPVIIALPLMTMSYRRYPLTPLLYGCIFVHSVVLLVGGAYSYARVPLGFEIQHWLDLSRNPYDKIGHFMQGFEPAILAREILLRGQHVKGRKMLVYVILSIVLAFSACYELIEWGAAVALGQGADEFLATQGDPWDTQSDMLFAIIGGVCALVSLSAWHDRQLARLRHQASNS
jgi:putative membrane protein